MNETETATREDHLRFVEKIANEAVAQAIERHRRLGESIAIWRDGQVVIVPPEEIAPRPLEPPRHMPQP